MKFGKLRTLRGQITVAGGIGRANLIASDGLVNYGLLIKKFQVWNSVAPDGTANRSHTAILSLDTISSGSDMNAGDNRQFAWDQASVKTTTGGIVQPYNIIDPDHIVNRDLFLTLTNSSDGVYNYLIEAQVVELTDDEAIITIIKETSQS
tara:strand:- start:516 stop:965 length:450 start_codon:yes stop_codon:yes gene_type:complete